MTATPSAYRVTVSDPWTRKSTPAGAGVLHSLVSPPASSGQYGTWISRSVLCVFSAPRLKVITSR